MKKAKRILALTGVVLLVAMYAATLVFALTDSPHSFSLFKASIYCTIVIPVIFYSGTLIFNNASKRKEWTVDEEEKEDSDGPETNRESHDKRNSPKNK